MLRRDIADIRADPDKSESAVTIKNGFVQTIGIQLRPTPLSPISLMFICSGESSTRPPLFTTRMLETGANDVLVVVDGEVERLIPFLQPQTVLKVDLANQLIIVDWDPDF